MLKVCLLVLAAVALTAAEEHKAIALLQDNSSGRVRILGNVTLQQATTNGPVTISVHIEGLNANQEHGFHIHEKGDISLCTNAGGHFNPHMKKHGGPKDSERHVGDLGNIKADNLGVVKTTITDSIVSLTGVNGVVGRAVVVHGLADDLGKAGNKESETTGSAGPRLMCGVIGIQSPVSPWMASGADKNAPLSILASLLSLIIAVNFFV